METKIEFDPGIGIAEAIKRHRLVVPLNQREYSWEIEHVNDLLFDLSNSMSTGKEIYFLGTVVLTRNDNGILEVADGQQRLATTTMMLAAIRDIYLDLGDDESAKSIESDFLFTYDRAAKEKVQKLKLNAEDNQFFFSTIVARPKERNRTAATLGHSHQLMEGAFRRIYEYLNNLKAQLGDVGFSNALSRWADFLQNNATVIAMIVPNDLDAFTMFETLNDRGLKTSQADLVKNHLFKEAGIRHPEAQTNWSAMRGAIDAIGEDDLTIDFLRHVCNLLYGQTRERDVFEKIKSNNKGSGAAVAFLSLLKDLAQNYAAILNPDHPKWNTYSPDIRQYVRTLNLLKVSQIRPLLLGAARHFEPGPATRAFERFVAWTVRFLICGGGRGGDMERNYCDLGHKIYAGQIKSVAQLDKDAESIVPTDAFFEARFGTAVVNVGKLARYYLRSLERTASGQKQPELIVNDDASAVNLEHIMPKTVSENWKSVSEKDMEAHANRLGNLILLQAELNTEIDRDDFATKRKAYNKSSFLLTSQVAEGKLKQWGVDEIDNRQKVLAALAVKTWKITG